MNSDEPSTITKYIKSIELSHDDEYLFSVGVFTDNHPSKDQPEHKGFINAMKFNANLKESCLHIVDKTSNPEKKGMYRIDRCEGSTDLLVSSWSDVFVYSFDGNLFSLKHSFNQLHTNLIYNMIPLKDGFYTCSNDCDASLVTY